MGTRKKHAAVTTEGTGLYWILAVVLALSIGVPLVTGAVLRFIF